MKLLLLAVAVLVLNAGAVSPFQHSVTGATPINATAPDTATSLDSGEGDVTPPQSDESAGTIWRVHTERKDIALTFDDGPYPFYTPLLLHVLERSRVPATFFIVGRSAQEFPELVTRIVESGDEVGNHTFNHYTLTSLDDAEIATQIQSDGAFLERFTGKPLTLFRPPHGRVNRHVVDIASELGYHTILWSAAANDVKDVPPDVIVSRIMNEAGPGGIILLHSGQFRTIEALPQIIDDLRAQGYTFVTMSKLLEDGDNPRSDIETPLLRKRKGRD
ncbi:MAG: polysaccharide deacetylase family protein [Candidatus Eremiobacteraeota bacterium]|nr:polysaccharide deacetylase family protein [Candidatus Eremiobacteraeota bacterium]MBV8338995.1 polysaccharide deacetylase family protein [Candidatus Eremiobacteraeota bacterium]MBV8670245.1 polysaccharide deacetylase family protein [Candidatus Eremiobacteraeota bacterium]